MTLTINETQHKGLFVTFTINETQHNVPSAIIRCIIMLSVKIYLLLC